tara:strand:- start:48 stop:1103 length:1056 start_codon:yes stop_codon:yes gene_type:complete
MNQKKQLVSVQALLISLIAIVIVGIVAIAYMIGKKGSAPVVDANSPAQSTLPVAPSPAANAQTSTLKPTPPAAPQPKGLTSAELGKAKNVPPTLSDPGGDYQIVAVIEGEEANRELTSGLQIIGAQRQRLLALSRQYDQTPAASIQQRELIAGEILKSRNLLSKNLRFMRAKYAYSLQFNYRLIPHTASLFLISTGEDGKPSPEKIHEFTDSALYERFQKMRDDYLILSVKESKKPASAPAEESSSTSDQKEGPATTAAVPVEGVAVPAGGAPVPAGEAAVPVSESPAGSGEPQENPPVKADDPDVADEVALTAEMTAIRQRMIQDYGYDPLKNHQLNFTKTALYARPGNQ